MRDLPEPFEPLPRSFYEPSARIVAPRLLGHWLVRRMPGGGFAGGRIVETEAYTLDDPACHAFAGPTARNRAMFGEPGRAYVYLIYGFHHCFNAVCRPAGEGEAVLIRAVEADFGQQWMRQNRPVPRETQLSSGPGKLCSALDIGRSLDGTDLCDPDAPVFVARSGSLTSFRRQRGPVITTTRIGLTRAADWPFRHYLDKSPFVSKRVRTQPG